SCVADRFNRRSRYKNKRRIRLTVTYDSVHRRLVTFSIRKFQSRSKSMKPRVQLFVPALIFSLLLFTLGCNKVNDTETRNEIQQRINADSGLSNKQIGVAVSNGVVTLSGTVDDITQWNAAAGYASSIKGVKQVVNNVQIAESTGVMPARAPVQAAQQQGGSAASKDSSPPTAAPAQKAERAPIPPGTPSPEVIHKKLNAFVYAANQQPPDQQQYDEMDCYNWAKSQ